MRLSKLELDRVTHYQASSPYRTDDGWAATLTELYSVRVDGSGRREGVGGIHKRAATLEGLDRSLRAMATPEWGVTCPATPVRVGSTLAGGEWTPGRTNPPLSLRVVAATAAEALSLVDAPAGSIARPL